MAAGAIVLTLAILLGVILLGRHQLRSLVRNQIVGRDAEVLQKLWMQEQTSEWSASFEPITDDPADHLMSLLDTNRFRQLPSVKGTRLFDKSGNFIIPFPEDLPDARLSEGDFRRVQNLNPVAHFQPHFAIKDLGMSHDQGSHKSLPILEILLPLHTRETNQLLGVAQFLLDGTSISREFDDLDRSLNRQAIAAFLITGSAVTIVLGLAFLALHRSNQLLAHRSQSLLQANRELALAAKTSALGSVTAHLLHGLKNPLSGLQSFMTEHDSEPAAGSQVDWAGAIATTRRMHDLVNETVRVLREHEGGIEYELSADELAQLVQSRLEVASKQSGVILVSRSTANVSLNNREANIVLLIIENLLNNAIQATPRGKSVTLRIQLTDSTLFFEVEDQGAGLPDHLKSVLFQPCQSTKEGGSGIGLAISKQLAASIGAELSLKRSCSHGCLFVLAVPVAELASHHPEPQHS